MKKVFTTVLVAALSIVASIHVLPSQLKITRIQLISKVAQENHPSAQKNVERWINDLGIKK